MNGTRRFIMICSARTLGASVGVDAERWAYVRGLSTSLVRGGHEVEVWTVQCDDRPPVEELTQGVLIRRFRAQCDYLVPRVRPCGWVSEWVAAATAHLAKAKGLVATLVTHDWEAGVAGRLLARRFEFAHVHVQHGAEVGRLPWQVDEDRETSRAATMVVATAMRQRAGLIGETYDLPADRVAVVPPGHGIGRRFVAALDGVPLASPVSLASIGSPQYARISVGRRGPWEADAGLAL